METENQIIPHSEFKWSVHVIRLKQGSLGLPSPSVIDNYTGYTPDDYGRIQTALVFNYNSSLQLKNLAQNITQMNIFNSNYSANI